jgi:hypothetical protein
MMDALQRLAALEDIKHLKARYWRGVDCKDHAMLRSVFADDAEIDMRSQQLDPVAAAAQPLPSPDEFVSHSLGMLEGVRTIHHGHLPDIAFTSDTEATGFWPMEDNLWVDGEHAKLPFKHLQGFGFYHDRYVKTEKGWRISYTTLERVHVNIA